MSCYMDFWVLINYNGDIMWMSWICVLYVNNIYIYIHYYIILYYTILYYIILYYIILYYIYIQLYDISGVVIRSSHRKLWHANPGSMISLKPRFVSYWDRSLKSNLWSLCLSLTFGLSKENLWLWLTVCHGTDGP